MRAVRRINNNVIICLDDSNNEIIARGKGIGFHDFPYEIDLGSIERTYYDIDSSYYEMIREIPDEIIEISTAIIDRARETFDTLDDSNIIFTLADHINFSIKRYRDDIPIKLPIVHDVQYLLKDEYDIGLYGLELIRKMLKIYLPKDEAAYIALHIHEVAAGSQSSAKSEEDIIADIVGIIEEKMEIEIDRESFNYSRFLSHMYYLLRRKAADEQPLLGNDSIYEKMVEEYPATYRTSESVAGYLKENTGADLSSEEKLYLMLHINRLCSRGQ